MSLNLPKKVWMYAERLYISTRENKPKEFIEFLKQFGIEYNNENYKELGDTKGLYGFMSNDDYTFANFMASVPEYKYLNVLELIIFDQKIKATKSDGWNYYGEYIKHWYPMLIGLLELAGVKIDTTSSKLIYAEPEEVTTSNDFLQHSFNDPFLDYIRKEANESCHMNLYLSVMFLSRKILEVICIRLLEVVFPKIVSGKYMKENHQLWFNSSQNRHHDFDVLIGNLKQKATSFHEDKDLILEFCSLIKPFKDETNSCIHKDYKIPDIQYLVTWRIDHLVNLGRKLFKKYYNP